MYLELFVKFMTYQIMLKCVKTHESRLYTGVIPQDWRDGNITVIHDIRKDQGNSVITIVLLL